MALIGLVRVSTDKQNTQRQHDALDPICLKVIEEKASGKLATSDRPDLLTALSYITRGRPADRPGGRRLGRNLLEGLIVLNDLFQQGIGVKVLEGIGAASTPSAPSSSTWPSPWPRTAAATIVRKTKNAWRPPASKARSEAAARGRRRQARRDPRPPPARGIHPHHRRRGEGLRRRRPQDPRSRCRGQPHRPAPDSLRSTP
ncbi:recombinase family protein [Nonomuraea dietziae]|uniref:recombinase family protein n=1 Tax=Nonomuraea dietziae TaxID=65515 RepID=UPI0031D83167